MRLLLKTIIPIFIIFLGCLIALSTDQPFDCNDLHCWDGITPGETTFKQAQLLLTKFHGEHNVVQRQGNLNFDKTSRIIDWHLSNNSPHHGTISTRMNIVAYAIFWYEHPRPTVAEVIAHSGARLPTSLYVSKTPLCEHVVLIFQNPEEHMWIDMYESDRGVHPDHTVHTLVLPPQQHDIDSFIGYDGVLLNWQDYIDYCDLIDAP